MSGKFSSTWFDSIEERLAQAERERDEWQAQAKVAEGYLSEERAEVVDLRAERDAALAKAEAADELAVKYAKEFDVARTETIALRARIEELADEWDRRGGVNFKLVASELRALLQPAKPETVTEVLARMEKEWDSGGMLDMPGDLAKLRKLLEGSGK